LETGTKQRGARYRVVRVIAPSLRGHRLSVGRSPAPDHVKPRTGEKSTFHEDPLRVCYRKVEAACARTAHARGNTIH
jgi:hypothetical protein